MPVQLFPPNIPIPKRLLDLVVAFIGGLALSPILLLTATLVRIFHGSPVVFKHIRPGYRNKPFTLYKFRTMKDTRDDSGNLLPDEKRLTMLGRILRAASLDELPELYNIIRGEMSFVGPRPLLMSYLDRYSTEQARRHDVLPGLTGWAQINGRNNVSWEDKFELDVWYVDNWSFWLDIKIIALTPWKVLKREGINEPGNATAREFTGSISED